MGEEKRKILEMLSTGKITVEEAEKLLSVVSDSSPDFEKSEDFAPKNLPKYLRILVEPAPGNESGEKVNIRVPVKLLRAGIKLASLIPREAQGKINSALQEKGITMDLSQITEENLGEIVDGLNDLTVDVEGKDRIRVFSE
jgi:hypothetical protein